MSSPLSGMGAAGLPSALGTTLPGGGFFSPVLGSTGIGSYAGMCE